MQANAQLCIAEDRYKLVSAMFEVKCGECRQSSLPVSEKNAKISPCDASSTNPVVRASRCTNLCFPSFHRFPSLPLSFSNKQPPNKPHKPPFAFLGVKPRLLDSGCSTFCSHIGQHGQPLFRRNLVLHQPARTLSGKHSLHLDRAVLRSSFD